MKQKRLFILFRKNKKVLICIFCIIGFFGLIISILPTLPLFAYYFLPKVSPDTQSPSLYTNTSSKIASEHLMRFPKEHTLIIPAIAVNAQVFEGQSSQLQNGLWRFPDSSTPEEGSNTVITGHNFYSYHNQVFYHLDKLQEGDLIILYWNHIEYRYRVDSLQTVDADATYVLAPSDSPQLTLFTCTPLYTHDQRFVVIASLQSLSIQ